jgi:hypothetical protein
MTSLFIPVFHRAFVIDRKDYFRQYRHTLDGHPERIVLLKRVRNGNPCPIALGRSGKGHGVHIY